MEKLFSSGVLAFPLSAVLAAIVLVAIFLLHSYSASGGKVSKVVRFMTGHKFSVALLSLCAVVIAVEGTWKLGLFHNPAFLMLMLLTVFCLGLYCLEAVRRRARLSWILDHCGIFLLLFGGFFGAPDFVSGNVKVTPGVPASYAVSSDGLTLPLGFSLELKEFRIDNYPDGVSPKQYTSVLEIDGQRFETSVNHPCRYKGYFIYQSDYDHNTCAYSVLHLVRDPWLPIIFLGMALLALGAILDMRGTWHSKAVIPIIIVLAVIFGFVSLARISFGTLMPALRSLWFVPHLIIYMVAYSVMAVSLALGLWSLRGSERMALISRKLLASASSLLIIGMLCGAVWAKYAWGDYWTWDAKECWAATTWLFTLAGIHLPISKKNTKIVCFILAAFLAIQVTWYGVNHLPSAQYSMHTYNTK